MAVECKTWFVPTDFMVPLCTTRFEPEEGFAACGVCLVPVKIVAATGTGTGLPEATGSAGPPP